MSELKVTFADGSVEIFHEEQVFCSIIKIQSDEGFSWANPGKYSLWSHHADKLVPSFLELLVNSKYFYDVENTGTIYSSNSIVKFENI